ncbi:leucyl/phenylalanyl-tRNA--protein transferase [uncultured Nocardioides sp.]|uniref:leucyl/phenylalanyl-tRNA--protein transferase n=1 Tax=uncultured Nocardioides sp. TaxID=198441 RepID=UPI002632B993|nr:leucyl/phenylalanyl-tRNA--protein transferase [uncultured Nocardioides sp.]
MTTPLPGARPGPGPEEVPYAISTHIDAERIMAGVRRGEVVLPSESPKWSEVLRHRFAGVDLVDYDHDEPTGFEYVWWRPTPACVIDTGAIRVGTSLRRALRRNGWTSTVDGAFERVLDECSQDRRPSWITPRYRAVLGELFDDGWAHSIEVWDGDDLVGGGFGFGWGQVLTLESLFSRADDGSRAAVADVSARAESAGVRLINLQWPTAHCQRVGGHEVPRDHLLEALSAAEGRLALPTGRADVARLLDRSSYGGAPADSPDDASRR